MNRPFIAFKLLIFLLVLPTFFGFPFAMKLSYKVFPVGPFDCNCTILFCEETNEVVIIDLGGNLPTIKKYISQNFPTATVTMLLFTHGHIDHILGASDGKKEWSNAKIAIHEEDLGLWNMLKVQAQMLGVPIGAKDMPQVDILLNESSDIPFNGSLIHTPGHSPGSACFLFKQALDDDVDLLVAGDTLFHGGVGRTDLWGGNSRQLSSSIKTKLFHLNENTKVITGHGYMTTIGTEKNISPVNYL
eukprot:GCRY01001029.1.p1 GENE.GCRY01001029.1~~GCRY01001029.1.p1  ORF type:complete len:258 (+),score=39.72 GCRY01001029.1:42-776(+)